jgi:hypothetical protein
MSFITGSLRFCAPQFRVVRKTIRGRTIVAAVLHDVNCLVSHSSEKHYARVPIGSVLSLYESLIQADQYLFSPYMGVGSMKVAGIYGDSTQFMSDEEYIELTTEQEEYEEQEMVELSEEQLAYLMSMMQESACNADEDMVE